MPNRPSVLLSPHSDDEALFGSLICLRYKPLVMVMTDSFIQYERGQNAITAHRRRDETRAACALLGIPGPPYFLGIADSNVKATLSQLIAGLKANLYSYLKDALLFIPAIQGGNSIHDITNVFGKETGCECIEYSTYAKGQAITPIDGFIELKPTEEEARIKQAALDCYTSQHWQSHFGAIHGRTSEWISRLPNVE